jgi:hypothetical protein
MENKQSSIEWYDNEIGKLFNQFTVDKITIYEFRTEQLKLKQQAKAMHKEEIKDALLFGDVLSPTTAENYYKVKFGGNK